jgi:hypothetical protein
MTPERKSLPTMAWHPETGENQIFDHPSEVPEGWLDTHPNNKPKAAKEAKAPAAGRVQGRADEQGRNRGGADRRRDPV